MSLRIPPRINRVCDWWSAHVARPVRTHPAAATVVTVPTVVAAAGWVLPPTTAGYLTVSLLSVLAGAVARTRAHRARVAGLVARYDADQREIGRLRQQANTLAGRIDHDSVSTSRIPTIGGPL